MVRHGRKVTSHKGKNMERCGMQTVRALSSASMDRALLCSIWCNKHKTIYIWFKWPRSLFNMWRSRWICNLPFETLCEVWETKFTGVSFWEAHMPHNIKHWKTERTSEGNDKETSLLKASRNTISLCYVIAADGGRLEKKELHSCSTQNGSPITNKVYAKKFIQVVKNLKL